MRDFSEWIRDRYFSFQREQGKVSSVSAFARHLGVSQQNLSNWINGDAKPSDHKNVQALVEKYGNEVYEILGIDPLVKDERLRLLNRNWHLLSESEKNEIAQKAGRIQEQRRDGQKAKTHK